jgi:hypothetical protein
MSSISASKRLQSASNSSRRSLSMTRGGRDSRQNPYTGFPVLKTLPLPVPVSIDKFLKAR